MNPTRLRAAGTITEYGDSGSSFSNHSIFTILEPSGKGLPLPGMPSFYASIIVGFATMSFIPRPMTPASDSTELTATAGQVS